MNQRQHAALAGKYQSDGMAGSSPQQLLLACFDRMGRDLQNAKQAIATNQVELAHRCLVNTQELVYELNLALDPTVWPTAKDLRAIYEHLMELLIEANLNKSMETIAQCEQIVSPLAETWAEAHRALQEQRLAPINGGGSY